jgi:hypothetical protein
VWILLALGIALGGISDELLLKRWSAIYNQAVVAAVIQDPRQTV